MFTYNLLWTTYAGILGSNSQGGNVGSFSARCYLEVNPIIIFHRHYNNIGNRYKELGEYKKSVADRTI